jgi:hypothetical protein
MVSANPDGADVMVEILKHLSAQIVPSAQPGGVA